MKRIGFLFEHIVSFDNLLCAANKAMKGKKDRENVQHFHFHLEKEILCLQEELSTGTYRPGGYRCFQIRDPKPRVISVAPFRDRVVHHAICNMIGPVIDRWLIADTFACRPGKGSHAAIKRAQYFAQTESYFLKLDIAQYFASINRSILKQILRRKFKDPKLLTLLDTIIDSPEGETGIPIGNLTSQFFANIYLGQMDHFIKGQLRVKGYVRYMDDFILFGDKRFLSECLEQIRYFVKKDLDLQLKERVTILAPVTRGIPFLGFRVFRNLILLKRTKWQQFKKQVRSLEKDYLEGQLGEEDLAASVQSMIGHIQHSNSFIARSRFFMGSLYLGG